MHQYNVFDAELQDLRLNFHDEILMDGRCGSWKILTDTPLSDGVELRLFQRPRENADLADFYVNLLSGMPNFLKSRFFLPKSPELAPLRVYLGYEAAPRARDPTPEP